MCTGRVDPATVAGAFRKKLDGLMVVGCYFGDCHYISGNVQAKLRIDMTKRLLTHVGLAEDRLAFVQCSSGEAAVFVDLITTFQERIRKLGPIGGGGDRVAAPELFEKLRTAQAVLAGEKMRWIIGKKTVFMESGNKYGEIFTEHEFDRAVDMIIVEETEVQEILAALKADAGSVKQLAATLTLPPERVFRHVMALMRKEMVRLEKVSGRTPYYMTVSQEVRQGG